MTEALTPDSSHVIAPYFMNVAIADLNELALNDHLDDSVEGGHTLVRHLSASGLDELRNVLRVEVTTAQLKDSALSRELNHALHEVEELSAVPHIDRKLAAWLEGRSSKQGLIEKLVGEDHRAAQYSHLLRELIGETANRTGLDLPEIGDHGVISTLQEWVRQPEVQALNPAASGRYRSESRPAVMALP